MKKSAIFISGIVILSLTACSSTASGAAKNSDDAKCKKYEFTISAIETKANDGVTEQLGVVDAFNAASDLGDLGVEYKTKKSKLVDSDVFNKYADTFETCLSDAAMTLLISSADAFAAAGN
ncbi:MAG: hypothetical protein RL196_464 [Actinomycetota bacterium]|jgi:hypothetical protein